MNREVTKAAVEAHIQNSEQVVAALLRQSDAITDIVAVLFEAVSEGGTIYTCGNGGSACDAMHLAEELVARYLRIRPGIKAQHLLDVGTISCWANDESYDEVFARQIQTLAGEKDIVVVFSTSGNSPNIVKALHAAREQGTKSVALLGKGGGKAVELADTSFVVDSNDTAHIQEAHVVLLHILCDRLEVLMYPD